MSIKTCCQCYTTQTNHLWNTNVARRPARESLFLINIQSNPQFELIWAELIFGNNSSLYNKIKDSYIKHTSSINHITNTQLQ